MGACAAGLKPLTALVTARPGWLLLPYLPIKGQRLQVPAPPSGWPLLPPCRVTPVSAVVLRAARHLSLKRRTPGFDGLISQHPGAAPLPLSCRM